MKNLAFDYQTEARDDKDASGAIKRAPSEDTGGKGNDCGSVHESQRESDTDDV